MISTLAQAFPNNIIGYSDHTLPKDMRSCEIATLLGAKIIEKHFTHDKTLPGNDHYHAMDKEDLRKFNKNLDRIFGLLGSFELTALKAENPARLNARRSLVALRNIKAGQTICADDLTFKRPAHGISPKFIDELIGQTALVDIQEDTVLQWNLFK